jgi:hypothetical protein
LRERSEFREKRRFEDVLLTQPTVVTEWEDEGVKEATFFVWEEERLKRWRFIVEEVEEARNLSP